jgi:hypothetical protein
VGELPEHFSSYLVELFERRQRAPHLRAGQLGLVLSRGKLTEALASRDLRTGRWVGTLVARHPQDTLESFRDAFAFRKADPARNVDGLRAPQLGGLHAVLGYWATHAEEAATVVMPTGTGMTDTMLAIYCESRLPRLLVIVPSDALRDQIANKFETLGVLQAFKVVARSARRPVVGQVRHAFSSAQAAEQFTRRVNVIVTTPPGAIRERARDQVRHSKGVLPPVYRRSASRSGDHLAPD